MNGFFIAVIVAICASTQVYAAWDYSVAAKVATYDASRDACLPIDKNITNMGLLNLRDEVQRMSQKEIQEIKNTEEYRVLYEEGVNSFRELINSKPGKERKIICKAIMGIDGRHL